MVAASLTKLWKAVPNLTVNYGDLLYFVLFMLICAFLVAASILKAVPVDGSREDRNTSDSIAIGLQLFELKVPAAQAVTRIDRSGAFDSSVRPLTFGHQK